MTPAVLSGPGPEEAVAQQGIIASPPPAAPEKPVPSAQTGAAPGRGGRWKLVLVVMVAMAAAGMGMRWWRGPAVATDVVVRQDFVQSVVASGHVETPHRIDIGAQITGTVVRVPVNEGQGVKAGDTLVELESGELRASARQAEIAVTQAQARLRQMRELQAPVAEQSLRQAQANLDNSRSALDRSRSLVARGFISESALDESRKSVEIADAQVRATQRQLTTAQPAGSDYAIAMASVSEARAGADVARARALYSAIRAPVDGTLIGRNVEVGDVVQAGKVLMTLSPTGRMQLVVEIDERNLHLLAVGQKALVSADAYPQERFAAQLVFINPGINAQTGAVEVKLDVPAPPAVLRQDMTVSVDIEVARRPQALLVPAAAVHDGDAAAPWVLRLESGHAVRRPVRLGLRSGGFAELLAGLEAGDRVIAATSNVAEGARVRTAAPAR